MKLIRIISIDEGDPCVGYNKIYLQIMGTRVYETVHCEN